MAKIKKYRWIITAGVFVLVAIAIVFVGYAPIGIMFLGDRASVTIYHKPCDIDWDGDCDKIDFWLFTRSIGQCEDGDNYNEVADADHDGCVTENDRQILFPDAP